MKSIADRWARTTRALKKKGLEVQRETGRSCENASGEILLVMMIPSKLWFSQYLLK